MQGSEKYWELKKSGSLSLVFMTGSKSPKFLASKGLAPLINSYTMHPTLHMSALSVYLSLWFSLNLITSGAIYKGVPT